MEERLNWILSRVVNCIFTVESSASHSNELSSHFIYTNPVYAPFNSVSSVCSAVGDGFNKLCTLCVKEFQTQKKYLNTYRFVQLANSHFLFVYFFSRSVIQKQLFYDSKFRNIIPGDDNKSEIHWNEIEFIDICLDFWSRWDRKKNGTIVEELEMQNSLSLKGDSFGKYCN